MLTEELSGNHSVAIPYSPNDLRLGHEDKAKYFLDKQLSKVLLDGKSRVFQLHNRYLKSYTSSQVFTVRAYRDMLMAMALSLSIRSMQSKDSAYVTLTTQANRFWSEVGHTFWPALPDPNDNPLYKPSIGLYGLAGSIAFSMYVQKDDSDGLLPNEFLKSCLAYVLSEVGSDYESDAKDDQKNLLEALGIKSSLALEYESALNKFHDEGSSTLDIEVLKLIRQNLLGPNDWASLKQRLILGEFSPSLLNILKVIESKAVNSQDFQNYYGLSNEQWLSDYVDTSLTLFRPAGVPLFYQAMTLKGILKAIDILESLDDDLFDQEIAFLVREETNNDWLLSVSENLATSYDAQAALGFFNTTYEAKGLSYRYFLTALQLSRWVPNLYISENGNTRLFEFL